MSHSLRTGSDFTNASFSIIIPPNENSTEPSDYIIPQLFNVTDDDIDEDVESFVLIAEIGADVPESFTSFQRPTQNVIPESCICSQRKKRETTSMESTARFGATKISINDNDGKFDLHIFCSMYLL